jgi:hypothetical protein
MERRNQSIPIVGKAACDFQGDADISNCALGDIFPHMSGQLGLGLWGVEWQGSVLRL